MSIIRMHLGVAWLIVLVIVANDGAPDVTGFAATKVFGMLTQKFAGFQIPTNIQSLDEKTKQKLFVMILIAATVKIPFESLAKFIPKEVTTKAVDHGFSMFAEHMGMGMAAKATKNMGFDITGLAKNMGVGGLTAVLKPFVKDDHMLTFIDGFLSTVLNSNTATQVEKLTVLLRGYLMVSVPYRNVQPHFQQDVFDCCVGKLVGVYAKENNVEATAVATMEVLEGFEMEIGNHSPKHQQQHKNL